MNDVGNLRREESVEQAVPIAKDFRQAANDICEKALKDAKEQLHPLIRSVEINRLDKRNEFVQAFKLALERRIARRLQVGSRGFRQSSSSMNYAWKTATPGMVRFISL